LISGVSVLTPMMTETAAMKLPRASKPFQPICSTQNPAERTATEVMDLKANIHFVKHPRQPNINAKESRQRANAAPAGTHLERAGRT
jgi:hypothetical protein